MPQSLLTERLDKVNTLIVITDLQIECAQLLHNKEETYSSMGWLLSILSGAPGTLLAVYKGSEAKRWSDLLFDLQESRVQLLIEKSHLERELGRR